MALVCSLHVGRRNKALHQPRHENAAPVTSNEQQVVENSRRRDCMRRCQAKTRERSGTRQDIDCSASNILYFTTSQEASRVFDSKKKMEPDSRALAIERQYVVHPRERQLCMNWPSYRDLSQVKRLHMAAAMSRMSPLWRINAAAPDYIDLNLIRPLN